MADLAGETAAGLGVVVMGAQRRALPADSAPLAAMLKERIAEEGPISVHDYMEACLADRHAGYYVTRQPIGKDGDFISAPEVSEMFGELIGAWIAAIWQAIGAPKPVVVESMTAQYYEYLPKESKPLDSMTPAKYSEVIVYHARQGKGADFRAAITKTTEAIEKTKWPVHYYWYSLVNGGRTGTFVLVIPHANWADFEDKPDMKPFPEMLKDAFGEAEAGALMKKFDDATESETTEINEFRADLSYIPAH